jgi:hypothetical protein
MVTSQLPICVQYLQALSTPAIALLALVIGVAQWRTAHQRAVLDLFDKRLAIFNALSVVVSKIVALGRVSHQDEMEFAQATRQVDFLFGPEVKRYLDELYRAMSEHAVAEIKYKHTKKPRKRWTLFSLRTTPLERSKHISMSSRSSCSPTSRCTRRHRGPCDKRLVAESP